MTTYLYLQEMLTLERKMNAEEYSIFVNKGYFTIRCTNKTWSGLWIDITIQQTLMLTLNTVGGLTHGRCISDSMKSKWILGMPVLIIFLTILNSS